VSGDEEITHEILHTSQNGVELVSSQADEESLAAIGLQPCYRTARMSDLIAAELEDNMDTLRYHVEGGGTEITELKQDPDMVEQNLDVVEQDTDTMEENLKHFGTSKSSKVAAVHLGSEIEPDHHSRVLRSTKELTGGALGEAGQYSFDRYVSLGYQ
jgi:uncharacterized protein (UPF0261 family)